MNSTLISLEWDWKTAPHIIIFKIKMKQNDHKIAIDLQCINHCVRVEYYTCALCIVRRYKYLEQYNGLERYRLNIFSIVFMWKLNVLHYVI